MNNTMKEGMIMEKAIAYLLENAGPVIRYRILTELIDTPDLDANEEVRKEVLALDETKKRFDFLSSGAKLDDFYGIHGATNEHMENALSRVLDFGITKGVHTFDTAMKPVIDRVRTVRVFKSDHVFYQFGDIIIVPFLYKAGYREDWIVNHMQKRVELLSSFAIKKDYNIFDESKDYKGIPVAYRNRKVISPELYAEGEFRIPLIYDLFGLAEMMTECDVETKEKIESVITYIFDPRYNEFDKGYGILYNGKNHYYAMGWDARLPQDEEDTISSNTLQKLELMAHFKTTVNHEWFQRNMAKIEAYKTERETYLLPKEALKERIGCWVLGHHMSLGENRRKKIWRELESTFRVLKIRKIVQNHDNI